MNPPSACPLDDRPTNLLLTLFFTSRLSRVVSHLRHQSFSSPVVTAPCRPSPARRWSVPCRLVFAFTCVMPLSVGLVGRPRAGCHGALADGLPPAHLAQGLAPGGPGSQLPLARSAVPRRPPGRLPRALAQARCPVAGSRTGPSGAYGGASLAWFRRTGVVPGRRHGPRAGGGFSRARPQAAGVGASQLPHPPRRRGAVADPLPLARSLAARRRSPPAHRCSRYGGCLSAASSRAMHVAGRSFRLLACRRGAVGSRLGARSRFLGRCLISPAITARRHALRGVGSLSPGPPGPATGGGGDEILGSHGRPSFPAAYEDFVVGLSPALPHGPGSPSAGGCFAADARVLRIFSSSTSRATLGLGAIYLFEPGEVGGSQP